MNTAWRLVKARHQRSAFDGEGAKLVGGRWNLPGTAVIYASESLALAALETFVHLGSATQYLRFVAFRITIPDTLLIERVAQKDLPPRWRNQPPPQETMLIGTRWASALRSCILSVPSVLIPRETNLLFNPSHPDFRKLSIDPPEPFSFDPRMWK